MKRRLQNLFCIFGTVLATGLYAQEYQQLTFSSGLNADVIANGVGSANLSTSVGVDNANFAFVSNDFQATSSSVAPAYGLPSTGIINSLVTTGLSYQISSYTGNNVLRLPLQNNTGTLAVSNGVTATKLFLLVTSGSGIGTMTGVITFTDNTTQNIASSTVPDWFNSTALPVANSGFGRINRANNVLENPAGNPRMYQMEVAIQAANQTKTISSIQLTKTSSIEGVINIFAITAQVLPTCPSPAALTTQTTATSGTVSWTAPVTLPAMGYDYYVSTLPTAPAVTAQPTGNVASGTNTVTVNDLAVGQQYYFWVRSHCSDTDKGTWIPVTFTTGQVTATYTLDTINTEYNAAPTVNSTTSCPGTLSVTVPDGFQIASVATTYNMSTASNGWKSEQRSILVCTTSNLKEAALSSGTGNAGGTQNYSRTGLTIANGLTGIVQFELRAWRTFGGNGCNNTYNMVDNNTWNVIVTYEPLPCTAPASPVAAAQVFCSGATAADLVVTGAEGAQYTWYTSATGNTTVTEGTVLATGTYYVSQTVADCESARTAVVVTINNTVAPTAAATQVFCSGAMINSLAVTATGTANWYASETSMEMLGAETMLVSGTYYVSQTANNCESTRTVVEVTVNTTTAPETQTIQDFCNSGIVSDLQATADGEVNWYASQTATEVLADNTTLASGTYYVSATNNNCESIRIPVTVNITTTAAPDVNAITTCSGTTMSELITDTTGQAVYTWSQTADAGIINGNEPVVSGIFYVSQTINGCTSITVPVQITVNETPVMVTASAQQDFTAGETIASLDVTADAGFTLNWYTMNDAGVLVPADTSMMLTDGMMYYVTQSGNGCESEAFGITATQVLAVKNHTITGVKLYPNPAESTITITAAENISGIVIYNMLGQKVVQNTAGTNNVTTNVSGLPSGNYMIEITAAGKTVKQKFVKK